MVSVRRRKMNRSGVSKNRRKNNNKGKFNPKSNPIIAKHWDSELTAKQNYKKLGLTFRLSATSGGEEKKIKISQINHGNMEESLFEEEDKKAEDEEEKDPYDPANILEGTAKLMKDENGNVVKVIYGTKKINKDITVNDEEESEEDKEEDNSKAKQVIAELEELASIPKKKEVHKMNEVEVVRYRKLIDKYGEDYEKMKWDQKLNPFQLSPGQLKKQIKKYLEIYGEKA
ncbi:Nucleolar protein 16 [Pichia californica]|uniref:Nucleolar protein 16 n=1 Tax=Pichia californica TaxID=460514 RepID=A0A9P6WNY3_9ASCO|nr:Nucleolar protein 16 [[Candida] californica]KAG0689587.1 Nucleolar protein 16 [[Candida] californica]